MLEHQDHQTLGNRGLGDLWHPQVLGIRKSQKVDGNSISLQSSLSFLKAIGIWSVGLGGLRRTVSSVGKNHVIYWMMDMLKVSRNS